MTIVAAFVAVSMSAQVYVGGSLGFGVTSYQAEDQDNETSFRILPEIGYNLTDDLAIGAYFGLNHLGEDANAWTVNPYARYTFAKFDKVSLFVDGGLEFETMKDAYTNFGVGFKPGIAVSLTDKLSFVSHLGFLGFRENNPNGDNNNTTNFGVDLDNGINFGLYFNF